MTIEHNHCFNIDYGECFESCPACRLNMYAEVLLMAAEAEMEDLKMQRRDGSRSAEIMQAIINKIRKGG